MAEILEYQSEEEEERHKEQFGGYNDLPPNFKEITLEEFAQSKFFSYGPMWVDYKQIDRLQWDESHYLSLILFGLYDGTGFAIHNDYWSKKLRFFKFARCEHEYRELTQQECGERRINHFGMCWHVIECQKCGRIESYDSSG